MWHRVVALVSVGLPLVGDLNTDGFADVLIDANETLWWFVGDGQGGLADPIALAFGPGTAQLGDMDSDGDHDIVRSTSENLVLHRNDGTGTFSAEVIGERILRGSFILADGRFRGQQMRKTRANATMLAHLHATHAKSRSRSTSFCVPRNAATTGPSMDTPVLEAGLM